MSTWTRWSCSGRSRTRTARPGRWWFAAGACLGSAVWFAGLGFGARLAAGLLATPRAWQVLDLLIAATMLGIAVKLALG